MSSRAALGNAFDVKMTTKYESRKVKRLVQNKFTLVGVSMLAKETELMLLYVGRCGYFVNSIKEKGSCRKIENCELEHILIACYHPFLNACICVVKFTPSNGYEINS